MTADFIRYAKLNWNSSIVGFSATPLRTGKTMKRNNTEILTDLFKNEQTGHLNILTNYNINKAISNNIILKPKFNWFHFKNNKKNNIKNEDLKIEKSHSQSRGLFNRKQFIITFFFVICDKTLI